MSKNKDKYPLFHSKSIISRYKDESKVYSFLDLVLSHNKNINLVSRETSRDNLIHIAADCLVPPEFGHTVHGRVFDIGPGAGFPSIVTLLTHPEMEAVLIERTKKKALFLERMIGLFSLKAVVIHLNLTDAVMQLDPGSFDYGLMRYIKLDKKLLENSLSLLKPGGKFIYYSRLHNSEDVKYSIIRTERLSYYLDDTEHLRTINIISRKT